MLKKLGAIVVVCCMLIGMIPAQAVYEREFSVWDGSVTENWLPELATADLRGETVYINSAADFIAFRNAVWEGTTYAAWGGGPKYNFWKLNVILNCDIDLNNINLRYGVGGYDNATAFMGRFNGNGHIIKNIKINPNLPDGADVQPGENNPYPGDETVTAEYLRNNRVGLFGTLRGDNDTSVCNGGRIENLHIENVEITIPDSSRTTTYNKTSPTYVGGMVGYIYDQGDIISSTAKNVTIKGGPTAPVSGHYYYIGGLAGGVATGTIKNSYVNGVDLTGVEPGYHSSWTYQAGMANVVQTLRYLNIYSADVTYSDEPYEYNDQPYAHSTTHFDSLLNPAGSSPTFTPISGNNAYAETPLRITSDGDGGIIEDTTVFTQLTTEGASFAGDGDKSYMVHRYTFNNEYAATGSERMLLGRNGKLLAGGSEIQNIASASGKDVSAQFEILNSTRKEQNVTIIIAGYKDGVLVEVMSEIVVVPVTSGSETFGSNDGPGYVLSGRNNGYNIVTTVNKLPAMIGGDYDEIKAFCWNELSGLIPVAYSAAVGE